MRNERKNNFENFRESNNKTTQALKYHLLLGKNDKQLHKILKSND